MHVTLLPYIKSAGELKTKPTQHSVKELLSVGIQPEILLCRAEQAIPEAERKKIALFCNIKPERVIQALDVDSIYAVPANYHEQGFDEQVVRYFDLGKSKKPDLSQWQNIVKRVREPESEVTIAIVGKYMSMLDSYKSLCEALIHGGITNNVRVNMEWIESETLEKNVESARQRLENINNIVIPGGFGERGTEGMIWVAQFAREKKFRSSAFVSACNWRSLRPHGIWATCRKRHRANSAPPIMQ